MVTKPLQRVKSKIDSLRRKIYLLITLQAIFEFVFVCLSIGIVTFSLDYFLQFPFGVRLIFFLASFSLFFYIIIKKIYIPFRTKLSDEDLVLALEKANPELQDQLISAFQFERLLKDPHYKDSREMSLQVIAFVEQKSDQIRFSGILDIKKTVLKSILPIFIGSIVCICLSLFPNLPTLTSIYIKRNVFLKNTPWPRRTYLFLIKENFVVDGKNNIQIDVQTPEETEEVALWYKSETGLSLWKKQWLLKKEKTLFSGTIKAIKKNSYFYLKSGDIFSSMYKLIASESKKKQLPRKVNVKLKDYTITRAKGKSLYIKGMIRGKKIRDVKITYYFSNGKKYQYSTINDGKGFFKYDFQSLTEEFSLYFAGGDDVDNLPIYNIKVLTPPRMEKIKVWYLYPAYTKLKNTDWNNPTEEGNIKAIEGTNVVIGVKSNIDLEEGKIVFPGKYENILQPVYFGKTSPIAEIKEEKGFLYSRKKINVLYNTRYKIEFLGKNGLKDPSPSNFFIQTIKDQDPYIKIQKPTKRHIDMIATGTLPLRFKTVDDYGIQKISLKYKVNRGNWKEIVFGKEENGDKEYGPKEITSEYLLEISSLQASTVLTPGAAPVKRKIQKGDSISLKFCAKDNNPKQAKGLKESSTITISILDTTELGKILTEKLQEIKRQLRKIAENQFMQTEALDEFLSVDGKFEMSDIAKILQMKFSQRVVSRDVYTQYLEISEIIDSINNNGIWDIYTRRRIEKVQFFLKDIADKEINISKEQWDGTAQEFEAFDKNGDMFLKKEEIIKSYQAEEFIKKAYLTMRKDYKVGVKHLKAAKEKQNEIIEDLNKAITLLSNWENFNEVVRDLEDILKMQRSIVPKLKKLVEKK